MIFSYFVYWYILLYWIFLWYYIWLFGMIWSYITLNCVIFYEHTLSCGNKFIHIYNSIYIYSHGVYIQSYIHFVFMYRYTVRYLNIYMCVSLVYPSIHEPPYPSTHPMSSILAYATLIQSKQPPMRWCLRLWGSSDCETGWADRPSAAYCRAARKGLGGSSSSRKVFFSLNIYV